MSTNSEEVLARRDVARAERVAELQAHRKERIADHVVGMEIRGEDPTSRYNADELAFADDEIAARRAEREAELAAIAAHRADVAAHFYDWIGAFWRSKALRF